MIFHKRVKDLNMIRQVLFTLLIVSGAVSVFSQAISFSSPASWATLRNDTLVARAQIDTAQIKKKNISVTLSLITDGKTKVISSRNFKISDYYGEFSFGKLKKDIVGGTGYLKLDWEIKGEQQKGTISPIGIVDLEKMEKAAPVAAIGVKDGAKMSEVGAAVKDENFSKTGSVQFATAWNKDALFLVIKKSQDSGTVMFSIDGKSGKNAFLSYPDRIIAYSPAQGTVTGLHYTRAIKNDSLQYSKNAWQTEIKKEESGDKVVVRIPWYDTGIVPFAERKIGFGVFAEDVGGKVVSALPSKAQIFVPGSWGEMELGK